MVVAQYLGLLANLVGVAPEKAIKLAANDYFRRKFSESSWVPVGKRGRVHELPTSLGVVAGASAGFAQVIATTPMEAVKIRMQLVAVCNAGGALSVPKTSDIINEMGLRGMYRGLGATLCRDIPFSMGFFELSAYFQKKLTESGSKPGFGIVFVSGVSAGAIAAVMVTPMDGKSACGSAGRIKSISGQD